MKNIGTTISYVVYQPNYLPESGHKYVKAKQLKDAKKIAKRFGFGSVIHRVIEKNRNGSYTTWQIFFWGEYVQTGKIKRK